LFIILLIDILWYYLIKTDFFVRGRITRHVHKIASVRPTDWLTILPSILLSKYNASLTGPPATLFTRCHVFQTWLLSTASLAGTHSRNELFHPPRRRERERERERKGTREKSIGVWRVPPSKENIVADTAKPPPLRPLVTPLQERAKRGLKCRRYYGGWNDYESYSRRWLDNVSRELPLRNGFPLAL